MPNWRDLIDDVVIIGGSTLAVMLLMPDASLLLQVTVTIAVVIATCFIVGFARGLFGAVGEAKEDDDG